MLHAFALTCLVVSASLGLQPSCAVDVVFILDGSSSITKADWAQDLAFITNATRALNVTADGTHIGIVQFGAPFGNIRTSVESQLTGSLSSLLQSIPNIQQIQGSTPTGVGLEFAQLEVFSKSGRPSHPHVMVLITDGKSNLGVNPIQVATTLKK